MGCLTLHHPFKVNWVGSIAQGIHTLQRFSLVDCVVVGGFTTICGCVKYLSLHLHMFFLSSDSEFSSFCNGQLVWNGNKELCKHLLCSTLVTRNQLPVGLLNYLRNVYTYDDLVKWGHSSFGKVNMKRIQELCLYVFLASKVALAELFAKKKLHWIFMYANQLTSLTIHNWKLMFFSCLG